MTPVTLKGTGQTATEEFIPPAPVSVATFAHSGQRNFVVWIYQGGKKDLLVNAIGRYAGTRLIWGQEPATLDIDADGAWTVEIKPVGQASSAALTGTGDDVSGLFEPPSTGAWEFTHDGERNFVVWLHCAGGSDLIQNEVGAVSGSGIVEFTEGPCLWEVEADGRWSLTPR